MAQIVIVTKQCYLICEGINFISVDEVKQDDYKASYGSRPKTKKKKSEDDVMYEITIDFIPAANNSAANNSNRNRDLGSVTINVLGRTRCLALFEDMVKQIRDQMPDVLWLNKLVENFLIDEEK